jgi:hypothetical protein
MKRIRAPAAAGRSTSAAASTRNAAAGGTNLVHADRGTARLHGRAAKGPFRGLPVVGRRHFLVRRGFLTVKRRARAGEEDGHGEQAQRGHRTEQDAAGRRALLAPYRSTSTPCQNAT